MFTTDPFSIRAERGMGEYDPPGTYRERGVEGGARTAREDVVGALLRFVRADKAVSVPLPTFLLVQVFSSRREKVQKPVDDGMKRS